LDIRSIHTIRTADNTEIELELAGIGPRFIAAGIDLILVSLLLVVLFFGVQLLKKLSPQLAETIYNFFFFRGLMDVPGLALLFSVLIGSYILGFAYFFFSEWLWQGQTLGKFWLNIRVVRHDGQPIGVWESFGRNLLRFFLDVYPIGLGIYPMMLSRREKRFGDFLVGTLVVNNSRLAWNRAASESLEQAIAKTLADQGVTENSRETAERLTPEEFDLIRSLLEREKALNATSARDLLTDTAAYLRERLYLNPLPTPTTAEEKTARLTADRAFLAELCRQYLASLGGDSPDVDPAIAAP
jgi:uncharacterized RDD family membrane protein YckC